MTTKRSPPRFRRQFPRGRRLCSPPPAKAYGFVPGSKIFTEGGGENRLIAGSPAADFAPRRPQRLTVSSRGAKSSHRAAAEIALLPARRPRTLLPAARKGIRLRIGEQNLHTRRGGSRLIAGNGVADFAPRRPQRHTASYRGAKSSHKAAAENALLPSRIPFLRHR